jgi:CHASE domain
MPGRGTGLWVVVAAMLVAGGMVAAVLTARAVARSNAARARTASHLTSTEIASALKLAIRREEDLTVSTSAFVRDNPHVTAAAFDIWVESMNSMQRYPELQNIGLVRLVPASGLTAFEARMAADPLHPFGPRSTVPVGELQIVPAGKRSHYCLAAAGMARNAAAYLPAGLDYCELVKTMITARDSGLTGYAPIAVGGPVALGVETPVYRGRVTPATVTARRHAFLGWLGELVEPSVLLQTALAGHPGVAAAFRYDSPAAHITFTRGTAGTMTQSTTIPLQVGRQAGLANPHAGWTVQILTASVAGGVLEDSDARAMLIAGVLLSMSLGSLALVLGSGRTRARRLVRAKTRELSQKNRELSDVALHDPLTGLPNRTLVLDRAARCSHAPPGNRMWWPGRCLSMSMALSVSTMS